MIVRLVAAVVAVAAVQAQGSGRSPDPVTVAAAVSLTEALQEIAKAYEASGGGAVRFNLAGSNVLARQIVNGAPADVFISADEAQMDVAEKAAAIVPGSRVVVVENQLAVVTTPDRAEFVRREFARAPAEIRRVAIGDPAAVPAGVYARRYLESKGLWNAYEPRIVPTTNVRAALTAVETGSVDAAIVYVTDLAAARTAVLAFAIAPGDGPRIVYPAALVAASRNRSEAKRFLEFLRSPAAAAVFARHKFTVPDRGSTGVRPGFDRPGARVVGFLRRYPRSSRQIWSALV
jgi:molybdate transport system substrate-binding protein